MSKEKIAITTVSQDVNRMGYTSPGYRKLHLLACDGKIPAFQESGRWFVYRQDLPALIKALGLAPVSLHSAV